MSLESRKSLEFVTLLDRLYISDDRYKNNDSEHEYKLDV